MNKVRRLDAAGRRAQAQRLSARGAEFLRKENLERAIPLLVRAHALAPDDVAVAANLGGALVMDSRYEQAVPILERACEVAPTYVTAWINLGTAYLGELESSTDEQQHKAIAAFERAIELDPIAPSVHYNLGLIHRHRGEVEQAAARFHQAVQANPLDEDARRAWQRLTHETRE